MTEICSNCEQNFATSSPKFCPWCGAHYSPKSIAVPLSEAVQTSLGAAVLPGLPTTPAVEKLKKSGLNSPATSLSPRTGSTRRALNVFAVLLLILGATFSLFKKFSNPVSSPVMGIERVVMEPGLIAPVGGRYATEIDGNKAQMSIDIDGLTATVGFQADNGRAGCRFEGSGRLEGAQVMIGPDVNQCSVAIQFYKDAAQVETNTECFRNYCGMQAGGVEGRYRRLLK